MTFLNLTGQRFGRLTVIHEEPSTGMRDHRWYCKCDCGCTTIASTHNLRSGDTKSCGCIHREKLHKDLTGKRFGRLTVVKLIRFDRSRAARWLCKCDCGNEVELSCNALVSGNTKSCGCLIRDVQRKRMIEYNTKYFDKESLMLSRRILGMKARCYNKNSPAYKNYGARGIKICDEWLSDTNNFINWAKKNGFRPGLSIDRIDVNGDYCPENCRFVSYVEQSNNRRNNRLIRIRDLTQSVAMWINGLGMPKWYHKEIYSEPDHVITDIIMQRFTHIIRSLHLENVRSAKDIIRIYSENKDKVD